MLGQPDGLVQIAGFVRRNAARFRDRVAYVADGRRWTWHDVDRASDRLAWRFRELGIGRQDHVAIFGKNSAAFILTEYALFKLGATAVIVNASLKARTLALQLNHADVTAVVSGDGLQAVVNAVRDALNASLFLTWDGHDRSEGVVNLDAVVNDDAPDVPFPMVSVDPADIACLAFSSGTTGTPKGAINTYWNLLAKTVSLGFGQEFVQSDIGLLVTPLCMGGSQFMCIHPYVMLGIGAVILPSFDPGEVLRTIEAERVSTVFLVPTMTNALVNHPDFATRDLSSWKSLVSSGAPLPVEIYQRVRERGIGILECAGTSESGGGIMISSAEKATKPGSVGRAQIGFDVAVIDGEGQPVPQGEVGELVIRGDAVASGYYKQPEIEAEIFKDGWFHTGDIARWDADGFLYYADRKKDMIKSGGLNVFPKDIEEILYKVPGLVECAVVGLPHAHWGEAVTAFVVRHPESLLDEATVIAALKDWLAGYQIPKGVVFVETLPKTVFGKISKVDLRQDFAGFYSEKTG
jgi:acyl-CoA synthetase (AMP-forming)/AMP-acid ligase II